MEDIVLAFGQHAGRTLAEVPRDYVEWLSAQDIRKQPEAAQAARAFLAARPTAKPRTQVPGPAPRTHAEASKLAWMAEKRYGNAKATLLAARDEDGFLSVIDEEDDQEHLVFLQVLDNGSIHDGRFESVAQAKRVLARYPALARDGRYLEDAQETEEMEAHLKKRSLSFESQDGKSAIKLVVWSAEQIDVFINGVQQCGYSFREPTADEGQTWKDVAALLIPEYDEARKIGLTAERAAKVRMVLQNA